MLARHGKDRDAMSDDSSNGQKVQSQESSVFSQSIPLHPMQRMAGKHLLKSQEINAPVTILGEVDADHLVEFRSGLSTSTPGQPNQKISLTAVLIALTAATLRHHSPLNAARVGNNLEVFTDINIGVALALSDGNLIVPVVRQADTLDLETIVQLLSGFRHRGEAGKLTLGDVKGATFTLTNAGMVPAARWTTPIIPLGQTAILGIGGVRRAPVVRGEKVVPGWLLPLSLTFDHAAINGYPAARFLDQLAANIMAPEETIGALMSSPITLSNGEKESHDD
jgi:pyruvate dehydrogenase E2 component (dihydrolipoamide acetyltransferase)